MLFGAGAFGAGLSRYQPKLHAAERARIMYFCHWSEVKYYQKVDGRNIFFQQQQSLRAARCLLIDDILLPLSKSYYTPSLAAL